jgi:hypothetical protein
LNLTTASIVALFFLHGMVASFIAGNYFWNQKDRAVRLFGIALFFNGLTFGTWMVLAANRLNGVRIIAALAAVFLILALLGFYLSAIQHLNQSTYGAALMAGAVAALGLFVLRTFVFPSHLVVTENGYLLFDLNAVMKAVYIAALSVTVIPGANAVANKLDNAILSPLIKGCFTALVIGGIILASSRDTTLILIAGIVMSAAFLMLWTTLLAHQKKSHKQKAKTA